MSDNRLTRQLGYGTSQWHVPLASGKRLVFWSLKATVGLSKAALLYNDNSIYQWCKKGDMKMTASHRSCKNGKQLVQIYIGADFQNEADMDMLFNAMMNADIALRERELEAEKLCKCSKERTVLIRNRKSNTWKIWDAKRLSETLPNMTDQRREEFMDKVNQSARLCQYSNARLDNLTETWDDLKDTELPF